MKDKNINNFQNKQQPKPSAEAFHGLAGIIKNIEPETEADPMALLISFLVSFGNLIGRNAYYEVEATRHYPVLFAVLVGASSKGRKGTSWNIAKKIFKNIDEDWTKFNSKSGLSSGEGLKYNVRDAVKKHDNGAEIIVDNGITDKRLLIIESEFANALKVANRPGNTLSTSIRDAWDTGNLATLTKNDPITATDAHISILGHITVSELTKHLTETEAANGYANRFLWVFVKRSKLLAHGGNFDYDSLPYSEFRSVIEFARRPKRITMTNAAKDEWTKIYNELSKEKPGLLGSIISRSEAQVIRLALIYALLDQSETIACEHLRAGLAVWDYCEKSATHIFGDKYGDDTVDTIFSYMKQNGNGGMTTTELHRLFGNNKNRNEIERAISELLKNQKIKKRKEQTAGRPTEFYELNELN